MRGEPSEIQGYVDRMRENPNPRPMVPSRSALSGETRQPRRLLLLGDVHGDIDWFEYACGEAIDLGCDRILQLGDFGFWPHKPWGATFLRAAQDALASHGIECWWIDGNHENHDWLDAQPHDDGFWHAGPLVHCARGSRWEWSGVSFLACGGAYSIDKHRRRPHESWWAQETITEADIRRCGTEMVDVLVTHDAPWGTPNVLGPGTAGDKDSYPESAANRRAVAALCDAVEPRLLVHGHYHHRNTATYKGTHVEGFGRDGDSRSIGTLDLPDLAIDAPLPSVVTGGDVTDPT